MVELSLSQTTTAWRADGRGTAITNNHCNIEEWMETTAWRADGRGPEHTLNIEEWMESKEQDLQDFDV